MSSNLYPGFSFPAEQLSAFSFSVDTFIISLHDQQITTYTSDDPEDFKTWLENCGVRNVQETPQGPILDNEQNYKDIAEWFVHFLILLSLPLRKVLYLNIRRLQTGLNNL